MAMVDSYSQFEYEALIYYDKEKGDRPQVWPLLPCMKEGPISLQKTVFMVWNKD